MLLQGGGQIEVKTGSVDGSVGVRLYRTSVGVCADCGLGLCFGIGPELHGR